MKWSWTIGRIAGIKLRVHATFIILLAWLALVDYQVTGTGNGALRGVLFTVALFASVVLHELGHALAARRFGVSTRDITLLPIGGVARLESIPDKPRQELVIALAGPAVTVIIALGLALALRVFGLPATMTGDVLARGNSAAFIAELMWVNVTLLLFNLLPAFPMDGGRVLRAILALRMDYVRATEIAARVGKMFALLFGMVGLLYNPFLVLIALFVWISAATESVALHERLALSGVPVSRVMIRDVRTLGLSNTLADALQLVLAGFQHDFPVVNEEKVVGVLTRKALMEGLARRGPDSLVSVAMESQFPTADPDEPLDGAWKRLRESRSQSLPVLSAGRLSGLLTSDNIAELVMIDSALHASARGAQRDQTASAVLSPQVRP